MASKYQDMTFESLRVHGLQGHGAHDDAGMEPLGQAVVNVLSA